MGFQQGLSGLNLSTKALDAISNNVANANTSGFKSAQVQFADVFAASLSGGGAAQIGIGGTVSSISQQFTQGNITVSANPLDLAINGGGMFRLSDAAGTSGTITYSRNGQFHVDKSGNIVNSSGNYLTGWPADPTSGLITSGTPTSLQLDTSLIAPNATTASQIQLNLDSRAAVPSGAGTQGTLTGNAVPGTLVITAANNTLNLTIDNIAASVDIPAATYGSVALLAAAVETAINSNATLSAAGVAADVTINGSGYIVITSRSVGTIGSQGFGSTVTRAGTGDGETNLLGAAPVAVSGTDTFSTSNPLSYTASTSQTVYDSLGNPHNLTMYFVKSSQGNAWQLYTALDSGTASAATKLSFTSAGALSTSMPLTQTFALTNGATSPYIFTLDLTGSTQYGVTFGVNELLQDGYTSGRLAGLSVSQEGIVQGRYSNGRSRNMGQLVLATFNNPNGLLQMGGNQWAETGESGPPIENAPGQGSLGVIQSAAIEESNVDLTAELVAMITQQRTYQANAQSIRTQDQILQTLVNLR